MRDWEPIFENYISGLTVADAAHDLEHVRRVVTNARLLTRREGASWAVVCPAAWLHDCVVIPKNSPDRPLAARFAALQARFCLQQWGYPEEHHVAIGHAIKAHSFSAGVAPESIEAKVVQDADRLDALGAIGICRCLMLGGQMGRPLYNPADPFCQEHEPDDSLFTLDHFYKKLLRLAHTMQTSTGRTLAVQRTEYMKSFLAQLGSELDFPRLAP